MEERQVTVDGKTYPLPRPFIVLATQNPIELEGTFPLPEAQLDRFLMRITIGYPSPAEERAILERFQSDDPLERLGAVSDPSRIVGMQRLCRGIHVSDPIRNYITELVGMTRRHPAFSYGASPRGSIGLMRAAQAVAALRNRAYVLPDDVKRVFEPVLAHRIILKDEEKLRDKTAMDFLDDILNQVTPPVTRAE
jgi:MoxR-like ATPase